MVCMFDDKTARNVVSSTLTGHYRSAWRNYGEVDQGTKDYRWNLFCKQCTWAPELNDHVKRTFEVKFADQMRDMFHAVAHRMNGKKLKWMIEEVHKDMMDVLANNDTY
ncbi:uncharacterized protein LOC110702290 [Chenopodium quinoa]|uniref:uncharacterized protein LOC110702290 n=1 Tax=Chenopodium quinoa TaxID=63459 RepID=UPI000B77962D|nr:uncharacterized protein LOC110702290 [Chenopodium quinoa]